MIRLLAHVFRRARAALAVAVVVGIASGLSRAMLLGLIDRGIHGGAGAGTFAAATALVLTTDVAARLILIRLSERVAYDLRLGLCQRALEAPLWKLEQIGPARLLATLTDDVMTFVTAMLAVPSAIVNVATVLACLVYLGWLSGTVLLSVVMLIAIGVATYYALMSEGIASSRRALDERNLMFGHLRQLALGGKELKQSAAKRRDFLAECLEPTSQRLHRERRTGLAYFAVADGWGQLLFFALIGGVLFAVPAVQTLAPGVLTGYVLVLLYMLVPLEGLLMAAPQFGRAEVAIDNIDNLGLRLSPEGGEAAATAEVAPPRSFRTLALRGVGYRYDNGFELGPIDLELRAGELVFVVGGNGSGKSTLAKVLTGLYEPSRGEVVVDGRRIEAGDREAYRQMFATVFADFCLFDRLLGVGGLDRDERARRLLTALQMDRKVTIENGVFSTTDLSTGQRKRLALLGACLEDRPILILDECAADQDPQFKAYFYGVLLPELQAQGRTVLAITHDDRYFHLADRVIKLDSGEVAYDAMAPMPALASGDNTR